MNTQTHTFHVHGMHCESCVLTTESELVEHPKVASASSDLKTCTVEISGDFGDMAPDEIVQELNAVLSRHSLSTVKEEKRAAWGDFSYAVPIALAFAALFVFLQKIGLVNLIGGGAVTYSTAFLIGAIASVSTCMAVVGGLLLSMSATFAKQGDTVRPQILFHGGRLVAFFVLGGVIGALGSVFALSSFATFALGILIGLVMLLLGINLLDVFHITKRLQPMMPRFLSRHALGVSKMNHVATPLLVGIATFFLPCGFTQSMQLYTLSTGSFVAGAMTMFVFALGTLPVLALISWSSWSIKDSTYAGVFFKSAGLVVILFALFNIINSLAAIGFIRPIFGF
jgi:uncharacterized protein